MPQHCLFEGCIHVLCSFFDVWHQALYRFWRLFSLERHWHGIIICSMGINKHTMNDCSIRSSEECNEELINTGQLVSIASTKTHSRCVALFVLITFDFDQNWIVTQFSIFFHRECGWSKEHFDVIWTGMWPAFEVDNTAQKSTHFSKIVSWFDTLRNPEERIDLEEFLICKRIIFIKVVELFVRKLDWIQKFVDTYG